jgi:DNA-binding transcriptional ArsR family regulator
MLPIGHMSAADDLSPVWKALADPTRRRLLDLLKDEARTTGDLCDQFPVSRFAIMKHLAILEQAGLIIVERRGRERWNHLNAVPLQQIYERWISAYQARWASSLLQFKRRVEEAAGRQSPRQRRRSGHARN